MYINPTGNNKSENSKKTKKSKRKKTSSTNSKSIEDGFFDILSNTEYKISEKEIKKLMDEILNFGNRFVKSPTQNNLKNYKHSIKEFLKKIEKKLYKVKEDIDMENDSPRLHVIAEVVDNKIKEITDAVMIKEKNTLFYASRVEEINGLLLDLYR
ncbi:MAG: YaaR family protein [Thermotogota bacterium]